MKKIFFVIILIASFVPCMFAQEAQLTPAESREISFIPSPESLMFSSKKVSAIVEIIQLCLISLAMILLMVLFWPESNARMTKTGTYEKLLFKQKLFRYAEALFLLAMGLSVSIIMISPGSLIGRHIIIGVFCLFMLAPLLLKQEKNNGRIDAFVNEMTQEAFLVYSTFGKFPDDMTEGERQKYFDISRKVAIELEKGLSGNKVEMVPNEK